MPDLRPACRRLRAYAFDPILSTCLDTSVINDIVLEVPWEYDRKTQADLLKPGPVGEYIEVIDYDPVNKCFYAPVNLNAPYLLAQNGLAPSESNPQFHQQMVYAVAMLTIRNFERALGRCMLWSPRINKKANSYEEEFVPRLRIYPHAMLEENAYYSPEKKALLFGYFPASGAEAGGNLPGGVVFACLSHDIIAHETTHALLDSLHRRYIEASNPDSLAFHEAFADLVALFQHFSLPGVLRHEIAETRGDLAAQNNLAKLAQQFGEAIGMRGALRDALGKIDEGTKQWQKLEPDPSKINQAFECHERGAILVAAIFDAFLTIYKSRIADLLRIASGGTGILPAGDIHPDLVERLTQEAAKSAGHILAMCIRALDYLPAVDVNFGDFFRGLITADLDMVPDDKWNYRLAVIDSFRRWGIYPRDVRSLAQDSLCWRPPTKEEKEFFKVLAPEVGQLQGLSSAWKLWSDRRQAYEEARENAIKVHGWLTSQKARSYAASGGRSKLNNSFGLELGKNAPATVFRDKTGWPLVEVHSVRPAVRQGPDGEDIRDMVIEITQRRRGYLEPEKQKSNDNKAAGQELDRPDFIFRGGATLLVDLETGELRYVISKRVGSDNRLEEQRKFIRGQEGMAMSAAYFAARAEDSIQEPFALLHRSTSSKGEWQ